MIVASAPGLATAPSTRAWRAERRPWERCARTVRTVSDWRCERSQQVDDVSTRIAQIVALLLFAIASPMVVAADVTAGRTKALACQACHGLDGLSKIPDAPNIAGQNEAYLATQLRAFKSNARKSEAMNLVAASLSDADIDNLAAYYGAIEIKVVKVPGQ